jgi:hypothetical protein
MRGRSGSVRQLLRLRSPLLGYLVDAPAAIAILESAHPEAAAWWKAHAPHFLRPRRKFVFHKGIGTVVERGGTTQGAA